MLLPVFNDLIKPQWRAVFLELKRAGGLPVSDLARRVDASYMAVKQHCEELKKIGYLDRTRVPRTAVGRPEVFYSLSAKADALFPQAGLGFTLKLLDELKHLLGESGPEKLLFQHFQNQQDRWEPLIGHMKAFEEKAGTLFSLREKEGCHCNFKIVSETLLHIEELHNPLQRVFEAYPRAVTMELRMIEQLLETRVTRRELPSGRNAQARVIFEVVIPPSR
jgi:predicted ArsR family transcriptional regulator